METKVDTSQYITKCDMSVTGEVKAEQGHQRLKNDNLHERDRARVKSLGFGQVTWKKSFQELKHSTGKDSEAGENGGGGRCD